MHCNIGLQCFWDHLISYFIISILVTLLRHTFSVPFEQQGIGCLITEWWSEKHNYFMVPKLQ